MAWAVIAMIGRWVPEDFSLARMIAGGFETIHVGHLHIHQDQIESAGAMLLDGCQRFSPVPGDDNRVAALLEQARGDQLVDLVVLGQENAQRFPGFRARSDESHLSASGPPDGVPRTARMASRSSASLIGFMR